MRSRVGKFSAAAGAVTLLSIAAAPNISAEPVATCTSEIVEGVEVDYCVGNPIANNGIEVPGVNVDFEFGLGIGFGF
jgi:hypothetical protein